MHASLLIGFLSALIATYQIVLIMVALTMNAIIVVHYFGTKKGLLARACTEPRGLHTICVVVVERSPYPHPSLFLLSYKT